MKIVSEKVNTNKFSIQEYLGKDFSVENISIKKGDYLILSLEAEKDKENPDTVFVVGKALMFSKFSKERHNL